LKFKILQEIFGGNLNFEGIKGVLQRSTSKKLAGEAQV